MDRNQMNLSEMLLTVEEFLTTNLSTFENKPAIMEVFNELKKKNVEIRSLTQTQSVSNEADYEIKSTDEDALIATAVKVSDGLKVIAATDKNERLKIDAKVSKWGLGRMRKDNMYVRIEQLHVTALPFVRRLLPLGISQAEVDSLETESTRLMKVKPAINNIDAKTEMATNDLEKAITGINAEVRNTLDNLMLEFKLLNPNLYGQYLNARKVNNRSASHATKTVEQKQ